MTKKTIALLLALILSLFLFSCKKEVVMEHCEVRMTLSREFERIENSDFDVAYSDGELVIGFTRISYSAAATEGIPASLSEEAFARLYADKVGLSRDLISSYGDFTYLSCMLESYHRSTDVFIRTPYAYFIVSFTHKEGGKWTLEKTLSLLKEISLNEDY